MLLYDYCGWMGGRCAPAPARFIYLHLPSTGTGSNTHLNVDLDLHFNRTLLLLTTPSGIEISGVRLVLDVDNWNASFLAILTVRCWLCNRPRLVKANCFEGHTVKFRFEARRHTFVCRLHARYRRT